MKRDILFRGKDLETGEWVYGYFTYCCSRYDDPEKESVADIIPVDVDRIYTGEYNCHQVHEVDINTVGQFTGLVDKNGTRIFEGDVLSVGRSKAFSGICLEVVHKDFQWQCINTKIPDLKYYIHRLEDYPDNYEVIGNIHDNPELLERK